MMIRIPETIRLAKERKERMLPRITFELFTIEQMKITAFYLE